MSRYRPLAAPDLVRPLPPCRYRGGQTGELLLPPHAPRPVAVPLYRCDVHGGCHGGNAGYGHWSCHHCQEREEPPLGPCPELLPGLADPLSEKRLDYLPPQWPESRAVRARHRAALVALVGAQLPPCPPRAGAGVVFVGGGKYWPMLRAAARMTRAYSGLPIRIYFRGEDEPVAPAELADVPGLSFHNLAALGPYRTLGGWEAKTCALLDVPWERCLYLDADAYLVGDVGPLLALVGPERPFVYWSDHDASLDCVNWSAIGLARPTAGVRVQGGQLLFHFPTFWRALVVAHWLNQHSDFYYRFGYGDQDQWPVALVATGTAGTCLGPASWRDCAFVCTHAERPVVVHRCQAKWWGRDTDRFHDRLPAEAEARTARAGPLPAPPQLPADQGAIVRCTTNIFDQPPAGPICPLGEASRVFAGVYAAGLWTRPGSSGRGSDADEAAPYVQLVKALALVGGWHTVADLGCGDGRVAASLDVPALHGVDCVPELVARLAAEHTNRQWSALDLDRDRDRLPVATVALLKDVLHHWPLALVEDWLAWAKRSRKWRGLLLTFDCNYATAGADCQLGAYRPLSPALPPLDNLGVVELTRYLHKVVCWLPC